MKYDGPVHLPPGFIGALTQVGVEEHESMFSGLAGDSLDELDALEHLRRLYAGGDLDLWEFWEQAENLGRRES